MRRRMKLLILLMISGIFVETAYANAGTPLMWAGFFHLAIGNLFIGIAEGLLLGFIFRRPKLQSIGIMILANYVTALLGAGILENVEPLIERSIGLYEIQRFIWMAYATAFLFTIIAELPFIYIMMQKTKQAIVRTLIASVIIQTLSYGAIFYWYWGCSYDSLFRNTTIVQTLETQNPEATLYFLGEDKNVYEMRLDGSDRQKIFDTPNKAELMKLYLQSSETGINLCVSCLEDFYVERQIDRIVVKENVLPESFRHVLNIEEHQMVETEAIDYRSQDQQAWEVSTAFWAAGGLILRNAKTKERYYINLETPFAQWYVRSATVLPGDEVVFQMGPQICLYSHPTGEITQLTKGTSPVVVLNSNILKEVTKNEE